MNLTSKKTLRKFSSNGNKAANFIENKNLFYSLREMNNKETTKEKVFVKFYYYE